MKTDAAKLIGIDARFYGEAGPGRYAKAIVEHLEKVDKENSYIIFLRKKGYELYKPKNPKFNKVLAHYSWYTFSEQIFFLIALLKHKLDLFYVPHFNIPVLYPGKLVTAIPDLIMHTFSTEKGTTLPKPYFKLKKIVYKAVVWWAVRRSKKIIIPSEAAIYDFKKVYSATNHKKYVLAYEGVDPVFLEDKSNSKEVLKKYSITKPFLLYVSSMYEHKNVPNLLDAFKLLVEKYKFDGQLVLVGKKDKFSQEIMKKIVKMDYKGKVLMPGMERYVTDEEVVSLRKEASLYVFPSLKEGFSLTPLEAQAVGLPCVISAIDIHKEIYGDSVLYFNPDDVSDMAVTINRALTGEFLRNRLIQKGYENLKKYDWNNTAKITLDVFTSVLA